jgi:hypoxia up-regulated 1
MEDWLYTDEAETAGVDILRTKLQTLTAVGDPVKMRVYELQRRPERIAGARALVGMVEKVANSWPDARPWLNATHIEELRQKACACSLPNAAWLIVMYTTDVDKSA